MHAHIHTCMHYACMHEAAVWSTTLWGGAGLTREIGVQYFIDSGKAAVLVNGNAVDTVNEGEFFGEAAFIATVGNLLGDVQREKLLSAMGLSHTDLLRVLRTGSIKAQVSCRCLELNVKSFVAAFKEDFDGMCAAMR